MAKRRKLSSHKAQIIYTGLDKSRFIVVCVENDTLINNNIRINSKFLVLTTVNLVLPYPVFKILSF